MDFEEYSRTVALLDADIAARPVRPIIIPQANPEPAMPPLQELAQDAAPGDENWPELRPLEDDCSDAEAPRSFPFAALGEILGAAAQVIATDVQAPDAMAGASVLAAAALAAQPLADVLLPNGQRKPLSLYVVTSAASGDRKSAVDDVACVEINRRAQEQARKYHHAMEAYRNDQATRDKGDPEPQEPKMQALTVGNATIEGTARLLRGQSSVGVFSPEGGEVLGGHSLKDSNRMAALAFFLKAWGAETLSVVRGGAGLTSLLGRRVSMSIMVQPVLLEQLLTDPLADGQGFLDRCLIAQPATLAGTRFFSHSNPHEHPAVQAYAARMAQLLDTAPELREGGDGYELKPRCLPLGADAAALWIEFYNVVEAEQAPGRELEDARAFASKAAEQAARIAGVITLFNDPEALEVNAEAMDGAVQLAAFYVHEHLRLTGKGKQAQTGKRLRTLLEWLQTQGQPLTTRQIAQKAPRAVRNLKTRGAQLLLEELAARGYIRHLGEFWEVRYGV